MDRIICEENSEQCPQALKARSAPPGKVSKVELLTLRKGPHPDAKHNEAALNKAAALLNALIDVKRITVLEPDAPAAPEAPLHAQAARHAPLTAAHAAHAGGSP